jgi:hypothetical protein
VQRVPTQFTSGVIEAGWDVNRAMNMSIHVDEANNILWGEFDIFICEGYVKFEKGAKNLKANQANKFNWRGYEAGCKYQITSQ